MKSIFTSLFGVFLFGLLVLAGSPAAWGQAATTLRGSVTDPSGSAIPNATVRLFNTGTNATRVSTTSANGEYVFLLLTPGAYRMEIEATGFTKYAQTGIHLLVNEPATIDVKLKIGSQQQTVTVTEASGAQINTTDASIGNAIGEEPISQLPFESRNVVGLLSLQPGVTYFADPQERDDYRSGSVNGGKSDQGNVTLDGVDVNDQQNRTAFTSVLRVTLDSVEEFRTTTTNGGADQGRSSGAQVSLVTKSGNNVYHGAAYEYHRNTITTANSYFNNLAGVGRPKLLRNVFGAAVGGPIEKDRLFFFVNYEGRRDASDSSTDPPRIVPNDTFRQGIFSYKTCTIYDINQNCIDPNAHTAQLTPAQIATEVDPLGIGPDPAILTLLQSYPHPNDTTVGDGLNTAGFRFNSKTPLRFNTYIARLDYQLDSAGKHHLFLRGNLQNDNFVSGIPQFPGQPNSSSHLENAKGIAIGYTWGISSTLVNNLRYGLTRQGYSDSGVQTVPYVTPRDMDQIFSGSRNLDAIIPVHQISDDLSWTRGNHTFQFGGVMRFISVARNDQGSSFSDGFMNSSWLADTGGSLLVPDADVNYGTDYVRQMTNLLGLVSEGDAQYNYDKAGNPLAEGESVKRKYIDNEYELYAMDSWKINRGLTVTAGLRVSLFPALYEANGNQTSSNIPTGEWFNIRGKLAAEGLPQSEVTPLDYILAGSPGGTGLYPNQHHFAPRFSIAYSPQSESGFMHKLFGGPGKSSIRAGIGMYYDILGQSLIQLANLTAQGFSTSISNPTTSTESTAPRFTSTTQIPPGLLPPAPPAGFPQVPPPDLLSITTGVDHNLKSPYTLNADLSYSREFGHGFLIQGAYIGRFSRRSLQGDDVATPTDLVDTISGTDYFSAATTMEKYVRANADVSTVQPIPWFENIFPGYAGGGFTATQNLYQNYWIFNPGNDTTALAEIDTNAYGCSPCSKFGPYALYNQQYASLAVFRTRGRGDYHSMQWTIRKTFTNGVQFDLNYTFGKSTDIGSTRETDGRVISQIINPWSPQQMKAVSDYDVRHIVSAFVVAELPFGRGKRFGSDMNKVANAFFGGWQISGIWRQSSSLPVGADNGGFWSTNWNVEGFGTLTMPTPQHTTKNAPGGPNIFPDKDVAYSAFAETFPGNSGSRNAIRGDGFFTIDSSLDKRFLMPWSEGQSLQFRAEVFNLTNTARFDVNQSSLLLGSQGSFGKYNGTLGTPRVMQFGLRYEF
jgi:Carboxypeptidase regulatory-like domain